MAVDFNSVPNNIEAEQAVIGSMFISKNAIERAKEAIDADDFYLDIHKKLYSVLIDLTNRHIPIDIRIVTAELDKRQLLDEVGGVEYIVKISDSVPTAANVDFYINIVREKALLRRLIDTATNIATKGYQSTDTIEDILDDAEKSILQVVKNRKSGEFKTIREVLIETTNYLDKISKTQGQITGVPTGFVDLDSMTAGLHENDLMILAARPAMGKTAFALNLAQNVAFAQNKAVAIFSLEMGARQLVMRVLSSVSGVDQQKLRKGMLNKEDWEHIFEASAQLSETNIYIDDTAGINVNDIRSKCRRLASSETGLGLVLIDYLQLITGSKVHGGNRQQEVSEISRSLKTMALELKVPVIALSQLSRSVETREDKRPQLSDLRESGSIEQDADIVAFLYRDDYYRKESTEQAESSVTELLIRKHRSGPIGTVELLFFKNTSLFKSMTNRPNQEE